MGKCHPEVSIRIQQQKPPCEVCLVSRRHRQKFLDIRETLHSTPSRCLSGVSLHRHCHPLRFVKAAARVALIFALMVSIGAHWGVLQMVAWASMVKAYSAEKGLVEGLKDTFDGERPCPMCLKIMASKKLAPPQDGQAPVPTQKVDKGFQWLAESQALAIPDSDEGNDLVPPLFSRVCLIAAQWSCTPPTPPPRGGA